MRGSWLELVIARTCVGKWGWVEVAAAVFPTGCQPDWPQNSWPPLIREPAGLKVLAGLKVIARSCVGLVRERVLNHGIREIHGNARR
jgi:hypothetical protein